MTLLPEVAPDPLLVARDTTWSWADLFLAATLRDEWSTLVTNRPPEPDGKAAEVGFRRARRLLAADELEEWLAENRLTVAEWRAYVHGGEPVNPWIAGICSGTFDTWKQRLAERAGALAAADPKPTPSPPPAAWFAHMPDADAAARIGIPVDEVAVRTELLWQAERALERLRIDAAAGDAIARTVAANNADWLRVDWELLEAGDENVAREAALLVREDGMNLPDVARVAGLPLAADRVFVGEQPAEIQPKLLSAAPGELVGPLALGGTGTWLLAHVRDKLVASADDPEIRSRAEAAAVKAAIERVVREEVRWRGDQR